jgi:diaminobutyrate-2-oxoglutarate transaminase
MDGLSNFANRPGYGEVRGLGLFVGLECTAAGALSAADVSAHLQATALSQGIMLERGGRDSAVLRFLPPLTITENEIDRMVTAIGVGFDALTV